MLTKNKRGVAWLGLIFANVWVTIGLVVVALLVLAGLGFGLAALLDFIINGIGFGLLAVIFAIGAVVAWRHPKADSMTTKTFAVLSVVFMLMQLASNWLLLG